MARAAGCSISREDAMAELEEILAEERREYAEERMLKVIERFGRLDKDVQDKVYAIRLKLFEKEVITEDDIKTLKKLDI